MPIRTLVVEDNPANMQLISYLLTAFGHSVLRADNGAQGLECALREKPDLVICDVQLPGVDGYEVARRLKANSDTRNIPLIAVTALAMVGDRAKVLEAGFDGYISKPIDPQTFVAQIEAYLIKSPAAPAGAPQPDGEAARRFHLLIVDDVQANIDLARSVFSPFGYELTMAHSVKEALMCLLQNKPDLILADVHLNGESGFDLLKAVKSISDLQALPFVFLTTTARQEFEMADALALGAVDFITRPIEPRSLLERVEACLRK